MFMSFWLLWSLIGLLAATALFAWSIRTRQFEDSKRAAMLPFDDVEPAPATERPGGGRLVFWTVTLLMALGVITVAILLVQAFSA